MRALRWNGTDAELVERDAPKPHDDMALVRVNLAGVCNTDLEIVKGYMGFRGTLGHEMVGVVVDGPPTWVGTRVVAEINFACRRCPVCAAGLQRHCPDRRVMGILGADGAFADYVAVPLANLHRVPENVEDEAAVFAEPLAAAFEILEQVHVRPGTETIVLGDGKLGLLAAQVLQQAGARVTAVGKHPAKLEILGRRGIQAVELADWKGGTAADLVVEATGSAAGFAAAVQATRPRGTLVLKSTTASGQELNLAPLVINEISVVGSRCGSFAPALHALEFGSIDVRSLISAERPLSEGPAALQLAAEHGMIKVLLRP